MAQTTPTKGPHWPPRSPHEALLSTPKGRERLRQLSDREGSPSPSKRSRGDSRAIMRPDLVNMDDDDDDEETLQLKLQEIQTRLRIKAAQKAKPAQDSQEIERPRIKPRPNSVTGGGRSVAEEIREQRRLKKAVENVVVPASPVRKARPLSEHFSPKRVLLGIDKGIKASDVSLRRAPGLRKDAANDSHDVSRAMSDSRPRSFSERMSQVRNEDAERREREARISKLRSKGFDLDRKQVESFKNAAKDLPESSYAPKPPEFSREEILNACTPSGSASGALGRSKSTSTAPSRGSRASMSATSSFPPPARRGRTKRVEPSDVPEAEASAFEPYSSIHLSKRIIPHGVLAREFTGKKTFLIPDLLRTIQAPDFAAPDVEGDFVVLGVVATKSEPLAHKTNIRDDVKRGKFMVITLCDLKWEVQLYLFNTAFEHFWKLTPGTVVAILNPGVMAPAPNRADAGRFNLKLASDADTILEVGTARDLGFCKSVKKDGALCNAWIDKRHTEFCDYHVNLSLSKTKAGRMEVNTMTAGQGFQRPKHRDMSHWQERKRDSLADAGTTYDRGSRSQIYISKGTGGPRSSGGGGGGTPMPRGRSAASMLDDEDVDPDAFQRGYSKEEQLRRRLASHEKERDIRAKLGATGGGIGADYMRRQSQTQSSSSQPNSSFHAPDDSSAAATAPDPALQSLLTSKGHAGSVHLSPIKRKRKENGSVSSNFEADLGGARGWGAGLSRDLAQMREGQSLTGLQPVKKKTRFVTAKGIREAGRESLGGAMGGEKGLGKGRGEEEEEDDDDLVIV